MNCGIGQDECKLALGEECGGLLPGCGQGLYCQIEDDSFGPYGPYYGTDDGNDYRIGVCVQNRKLQTNLKTENIEMKEKLKVMVEKYKEMQIELKENTNLLAILAILAILALWEVIVQLKSQFKSGFFR